jgi:hypothetical protein
MIILAQRAVPGVLPLCTRACYICCMVFLLAQFPLIDFTHVRHFQFISLHLSIIFYLFISLHEP